MGSQGNPCRKNNVVCIYFSTGAYAFPWILNLFIIGDKFSDPSCFLSAGEGYKSTKIFLVMMLDVSTAGISRSLYLKHVKEEYQLSEDEIHYENFDLF
ncbi:hypothetical protein RDI58_027241 [Solanum bulbocastanum]|uniref:Uncharacterized protein n=1 Tax=Solanum bulbocastanum TaxID=147425 RepID=A0AAN8SV51_SOLBU